ncbi:MAG: class I SAM-dependent methyltransferase [Candidatus Aminicenantes bacterium]|nr:MAG: class I SAM-dependent methyltransferase [Candidatus Aminicenantes bacterium]
MILIIIAAVVIGFFVYSAIANFISYSLLKNRILKSQKWDLNICCGQTDGKGINADIVQQKNIPNFHLIEDIYHLPFKTGQFNSVLCSHTIEHVDDPEQFFKELKRVGKQVTIVIPPLYDITAAFNVFEHQYIFFSFKKVHYQLPKYTRLPLAASIQKRIGQLNQSASSSPSIPLVFQLIFALFSASHRDQIKLKTNNKPPNQ